MRFRLIEKFVRFVSPGVVVVEGRLKVVCVCEKMVSGVDVYLS